MRLLIIGCGAVGKVIAQYVCQRGYNNWLEALVVSDYDMNQVNTLTSELSQQSVTVFGEQLDASCSKSIQSLCQKYDIDTIMDASPPFLADTIFDAAYEANCHFLNMGTWSLPKKQIQQPEQAMDVYEPFMAKYQLEQSNKWQQKSLTGIICVGIDPGVVNVFVNYCKNHLFDHIEEVHVRDGCNLQAKNPSDDISFGFNVWTVLDECLNPNITWHEKNGYVAHPPFSGEELFDFPEGIGIQKVYQIEHEEVYLFSEYLKNQGLKSCTYKIALDDNLVNALKTIETLGLRSLEEINIAGQSFKKRDILAKLLPQPSEIDDAFEGKMCVGVVVKGFKDGLQREIFMYQTFDQNEALAYHSQAVVAQTGIGAGIAVELMAKKKWSKPGVHGPEVFDSQSFIEIMKEINYRVSIMEKPSDYAEKKNKIIF